MMEFRPGIWEPCWECAHRHSLTCLKDPPAWDYSCWVASIDISPEDFQSARLFILEAHYHQLLRSFTGGIFDVKGMPIEVRPKFQMEPKPKLLPGSVPMA